MEIGPVYWKEKRPARPPTRRQATDQVSCSYRGRPPLVAQTPAPQVRKSNNQSAGRAASRFAKAQP